MTSGEERRTGGTGGTDGGIRSLRSTNLFRAVNFELYARPNVAVMGVGLVCFGLCLGYVAYMRSKYEATGHYSAVAGDGTEVFQKKTSKWD